MLLTCHERESSVVDVDCIHTSVALVAWFVSLSVCLYISRLTQGVLFVLCTGACTAVQYLHLKERCCLIEILCGSCSQGMSLQLS